MSLAISPWDAAIIVGYLLATVAWGAWYRVRQRSAAEYFLAGNQLPWWALLLSIVATETSTVTFLSVPGLSFKSPGGDFSFLQLALGFVVGRVIVAGLLLPGYFSGRIYTSYELLEHRFGRSTRWLASLLFLIARNVADALRLYLTALVLKNVTNLDQSLCVIVVGSATIVYTYWGGLRSVVWNDCVQFLVYIAGAAWALAVLVQQMPDGWSQIVDYGAAQGKLHWIDWSLDPTSQHITFWIGLIGGGFLTLATHGTDQMIVQRLLSARSQREASIALVLSGFVVFVQFAFFLMIGLALACFYDLSPPATAFANNDEVFASFIVHHLPVGVVGVILAAVFAAAMSTQSSSLNSSASALVNDFYRGPSGKCDSSSDSAGQSASGGAQDASLRAGRIATVLFGVLQIALALICQRFAADRSVVYNVLTIAGFTSGPVLGLFLLSLHLDSAGRPDSAGSQSRLHRASPLIAFVAGLGALISVASATQVNGLWYTAIGALVTYATGLLIRWGARIGRGP